MREDRGQLKEVRISKKEKRLANIEISQCLLMADDEEMKKNGSQAKKKSRTLSGTHDIRLEARRDFKILCKTSERSKVMSPRTTRLNKTWKKLMDVSPQKFQQELKVTHELFFNIFLGVTFIQ